MEAILTLGTHYSIKQIRFLHELKDFFPEGEANCMNFCLFSTSGVHGDHGTIEELNLKAGKEYNSVITILVVQPRLVKLTYGSISVSTEEDIEYLKKLRKSSWDAVSLIGK